MYNKPVKEEKPHYKAQWQKVKDEWHWVICEDDERFVFDVSNGKFWDNTGRYYRGD